MKGNYDNIYIFDLIYNGMMCSSNSVNPDVNKYILCLFSKSGSKQNYVFKGCFSLFLNIYSDDVFEVNCKNETEFKFFIKQDDKANNSDFSFDTFEYQAISSPTKSMKTLESKGFVCLDGKIENGKVKLVCVTENKELASVKRERECIYTSSDAESKKKIWNDLLAKREMQNKTKKTDYQNNLLNEKIKIINKQIRKENKPMSQDGFIDQVKE